MRAVTVRAAWFLLATLVACGDGAPHIGGDAPAIPEGARASLPTFPPAEQLVQAVASEPTLLPPDPAEARAPKVTAVVWRGPSELPTGLDVRFDLPMQTFPGARPLDARAPVQLVPAVKGTMSWASPQTLRVELDEALAVASRYRVEVASGLVAGNGRALAEPFTSVLRTTPLRVVYSTWGNVHYPTELEPNGAAVVQLNLPVALADLRGAVSVVASPRLAAVARGEGRAVPAIVKAVPRDDAGAGDLPAWSIAPVGGFGVGMFYRIRVAAGLKGPGTEGLDQDALIYARGPAPFQLSSVSCEWGECSPGQEWTVWFNNPVAAATAARCVTVSPALALGPVTAEGSYLRLSPRGARVGATYQVQATAGCRDVYGSRPVGGAVAVVVVKPPARLRMAEGVGYVAPPSAGEAVAIAASAKASGPLTVRRLRVTREGLAAFLQGRVGDYGGISLGTAPAEAVSAVVEPRAGLGEGGFVDTSILLDDYLGEDQRGVVYVEVETAEKASGDDPAVRRALVQVTDTALIAKTGPLETLIWASSLRSAEPLAGADVRLLDAQGKELWAGRTDPQGLARSPARSALSGKPRFVVASAGGDDLSILDLEQWETRIEPYRFDLPYAWGAEEQKEVLRGVAFTDRGVYRAGETVHVKALLRRDDGGELTVPAGARVVVRVVDPLGGELATQVKALGRYGDLDLEVTLAAAAALGSYTIEIAGEGQDGVAVQGGFRCEAYRPNTFEVLVDDAVRHDERVTAQVTARTLYGAALAGAAVRWAAYVKDATFTPAGFDGFDFGVEDDSWWWEPHDTSTGTLVDGDGVLDADGRLALSVATTTLDLSSGPKTVVLEASVADVDAQEVSGRASVRVDPGAFYLGLSDGGPLAEAKKPLPVALVAVAPDGTQVAGVPVTLKLSKRTWKSVRKAAAGGGMTWVSEATDEVQASARVVTTATGSVEAEFTPGESGYYTIEASATDAAGRTIHAAQTRWVWGGGEAWWAESDDDRLTMIPERDRYEVGETARILVQSPWSSARALVTVERLGVITERVIEVSGGAPLIEIPITKNMQPNAYVSVALVRGRVDDAAAVKDGVDHGKIASRVGYAQLHIDTADRRLAVAITPDRASYEPRAKVHAKVALADVDGQPVAGRVTFYAVDEGVLQLTGYHAPDPTVSMFAERPIAVSTVDSRRRIWARIEPSDDGMKGDWGGGGEGEAQTYRAAFATTAVYLPSVDVGEGGVTEVAFDLPDNVGAYRLMAVAVADGNRFGRAEQRVEVRKPVIARPGLPRFVSRGDAFDARVVVQALEEGAAGASTVTIAVGGPVALEGADTQQVVLALGERRAVSFKARATGVGTATIAFRVRRDGASEDGDAVRVEIPVQYPAATRQAVQSGRVGDDHGVKGVAAWRVAVPDWIDGAVGGLAIELAPSALGELLPGLRYLVQYPYGCVEQTTSGTLPLLALSEMGALELPGIPKDGVRVRAQAGVDHILSMQTYSGGLAYWPGLDDAHPWGSAYGGLALVRAKTAGFAVPEAALDKLRDYLRSVLQGKATSANDAWVRELHPVEPFAAWVLALSGAPDHAYDTRLFETRATLPTFSLALLALAAKAAGDDPAMATTLRGELVAAVTREGDRAFVRRKSDVWYHATMDSDVRTTALVLMALQELTPDDPLVDALARGLLAERRRARWLTTQDNGFAILALAAYFRRVERPGEQFLATVRLDGEVLLQAPMVGGTLTTSAVTLPMAKVRAAAGKVLTVTREGSDDAPLYYALRFEYVPREVPTVAVEHGFGIDREYTFAEGPDAGKPATSVKAGDLVRVTLTVRTTKPRRYVAIDDLLPAGLEPVETSFDTTTERVAVGDEGRWVFDHIEQRDDRVSLFANDLAAGQHTHAYLARATTAGDFLAPAARIHEMYQPDVFGQSAAVAFAVR